MAERRRRVALIFGGQSTEHQVSCLTAAAVAKAIDTDRYEVHGIGIAHSGTWHRMGLDEIRALRTIDGVLPELTDDSPRASLVREPEGAALVTRTGNGELTDRVQIDAVFTLLHGPYGEDGTIQGQLEMLGLPYVGSGVSASAVGMDKHLMKVVLGAAGLPVGPYEVVLPGPWHAQREDICRRIVGELEFPLFVKPARGGSSLGIVRVTDPDLLADAIDSAAGFDPKVIVEQGFVNAREVECAVLGPRAGERGARVSTPGEIVVHTESAFYDFEAKYLPGAGQVDLNIPAELPEELADRVRRVGVASFEAIGAEGLARVDTFITSAGEVFVNEVNTMPGFTELSMFPSLWQVSGLSYPELITDLIEQALARPNNVVR